MIHVTIYNNTKVDTFEAVPFFIRKPQKLFDNFQQGGGFHFRQDGLDAKHFDGEPERTQKTNKKMALAAALKASANWDLEPMSKQYCLGRQLLKKKSF